MKSYTFHSTILLLLVSISPALFAQNTTREIEETFEAESINKLDISTSSGNIQLIGEDRDDIHVTAIYRIKNVRESRVQEIIDQTTKESAIEGETLFLKYKTIENSFIATITGTGHSMSISLRIHLPKHIVARLHTSGGNINVEALNAHLSAQTSGGNISLKNIEGTVDAKTSGGHIWANSIALKAELRTSGGNLNLTNMYGPLDARTSGGNINASLPEGVVDFCELRTSGGNVKVTINANTPFDLNARTSGGRVQSDVPILTRGKIGTTSIEGTANGGGPKLSLRTSGGNISVGKI